MASSVSLVEVLRKYQLTEQQLDIPCPQEHSDEVARRLDRWELLAYSLGLTEGEVTAIQEENPKNYPLQRLKSLRKWRQKMGERATYLYLARKLEKESHMALVGKLCKLLLKSFEVKKKSEEIMSIDSDTKERSQQLKSTLDQFEKRFEQLVEMTLEELEEGKVTTRRLRLDLTLLPPKIKPNHLTYIENNIKILKKAEDLEEIFLHLNMYWDSFNYTLLEIIVSKHGSAALKQRMQTYVSEITAFMRETTVAEYIAVSGGQQGSNKVSEEFKELKCRFDKPANRYMLLEVVELRSRFCQRLQLPEFALKLFQLEDTSVTVTWLIHKELLHLFDELSIEDAQLLSPDIDSITIDGQFKRLKPVQRRLEAFPSPDYLEHPHKTKKEFAVKHRWEEIPSDLPSISSHAQRPTVGAWFGASVGGYLGLTLGAVLGSVLGVGAGVGAGVGLVVGALRGCCIGMYTYIPPPIVQAVSGIGIGGSTGATIGAAIMIPLRLYDKNLTRSILGELLGGLTSSAASTSAYAFAIGELIGIWINAIIMFEPGEHQVIILVSVVSGIFMVPSKKPIANVSLVGVLGVTIGMALPQQPLVNRVSVTVLYVIGGFLNWFGLHELGIMTSLGMPIIYFIGGPPYPDSTFLEATVIGSISGGMGWILSKAGLTNTSGVIIANILCTLVHFGYVGVVGTVIGALIGFCRASSGEDTGIFIGAVIGQAIGTLASTLQPCNNGYGSRW